MAHTEATIGSNVTETDPSYLDFLFKNSKLEIWAVILFLIVSLVVSISKMVRQHKFGNRTGTSARDTLVYTSIEKILADQLLTDGGRRRETEGIHGKGIWEPALTEERCHL